MVFSSTVFLFLFLPIVLVVYYLLQTKLRNVFLLLCSLFFYAWGENILVFLMIGSICVNYIFGILISNFQKQSQDALAKVTLSIAVTINLLVLVYYKYFHFIIDNLSLIGIKFSSTIAVVALPIGVSFFTFQNISYLVDVYRREVESQRNLIHLGLYISLFPQLIAGPIVRYIDVYKEIKNRIVSLELFKDGLIRFIRGIAKKVLIANTAALIADKVFAIATDDISSSIAWLGIICYTLQIYFDFSGYSDMAIGLGKMFGFNFKENFNYPYYAKSVQDFWRRWHISLSTWFRDYLYIPLGGNRSGKIRTFVNLLIVFFITGLWHGASWNFVIWGLYHGAFLLAERVNLFTLPKKIEFLKRIYLLLVVVIGWVFFRADNPDIALGFIAKMFSFSGGINNSPAIYLNNYTYFLLFLGLLFSTPLRIRVSGMLSTLKLPNMVLALKYIFYTALFSYTIIELAQATYNPFIYFRF